MRSHYFSLWYLSLAILSGVSYGFAGTIMKKGVLDFQIASKPLLFVRNLLTAKYIMIALFFSVVGTILYMILIKKAEVIPSLLIIQSVLFASTVFFAHVFFNESINLSKIVGLVLIMAGIAVLVTSK